MDDVQIHHAVRMVDTASTSAHEAAWASLKPLGVSAVPFLAEYFPHTKKAQGRVALVFHAIRFARESEAAFELGLLALNDKATLVRYRACGLCATSLRKDAIPHLERLLEHADEKTVTSEQKLRVGTIIYWTAGPAANLIRSYHDWPWREADNST